MTISIAMMWHETYDHFWYCYVYVIKVKEIGSKIEQIMSFQKLPYAMGYVPYKEGLLLSHSSHESLITSIS